MLDSFPSLDKRTARRIYAELVAIASTAIPEWKVTEDDGDFGQALLRISAELAEYVANRIERTPERDAIAFFDMLDIPLDAAQPAVVPLVFQLSAKRNLPVFVGPGIQVGAKTDSGEFIFESTKDLSLTPARLEFLVVVDGDADIIEQAPLSFLNLESHPPLPDFKTISFADADSDSIQISPAEGLDTGDDIRINNNVYRIEDRNENLFLLREKLTNSVKKSTPVYKVNRFDLFDMRNVQSHAVYIGHDELLNLEEASTISLQFQPVSIASKLIGPGFVWELYGTNESSNDKDLKTSWHKLPLIQGDSGELILLKNWKGKVEKKKIQEVDGLWLRVRFENPVFKAFLLKENAKTIKIKVKTLEEADLEAIPLPVDPCEKKAREQQLRDEQASKAEEVDGSNTINQAFHNSNPLPLTTRFLPFGPEPQRFDTFSIASPEVFSKQNARITLDVSLADASVVAMSLVQNVTSSRAYAVTANRGLLKLLFNDPMVWTDIGNPTLKTTAEIESNLDLELNSEFTPQPITVDDTMDVVIVTDSRNRYWAWTQKNPNENALWLELPEAASESVLALDVVLFNRQAVIILIAIIQDTLQYISIDTINFTAGTWLDLSYSNTVEQPLPNLASNSRLVRVESSAREGQPDEIVILDEGGDLWLATISDLSISQLQKLEPEHPANTKIKPAAVRNTDDSLSVIAANAKNSQLFITGIGIESNKALSGAEIHEYTAIQAHPAALPNGVLFVAFGVTAGDGEVYSVWNHEKPMFESQVPYGLDKPSGFIIPNDKAPILYVNGIGERVHRNLLSKKSDYRLNHPLLVANVDLNVKYYLEVKANNNSRQIVPIDYAMPVEGEKNRLFSVPSDKDVKINEDLDLFKKRDTYQGQRVPNERNQLKYNEDDKDSMEGSFLIIESKFYKVKARDEKEFILVLDRNLPPTLEKFDTINIKNEDYIDYTAVELQDPVLIKCDDQKRLLIIDDSQLSIKGPQYFRFQSMSGQENTDIERGIQFSIAVPDSNISWLMLDEEWEQKTDLSLECPEVQPPNELLPVEIIGADGGQWRNEIYPRGFQNPELAWEYFNGKSWRRLENRNFLDETENLASSGKIKFNAPGDLAVGEVAGQADYWVRARLVGGDYGRAEYKVSISEDGLTQTVIVDTSNLKPPEIIKIEASFESSIFEFPQRVLVDNNLDVRDQSQANANSTAEYALFTGASLLNRYQGNIITNYSQQVLYFGFSKSFKGQLSIFIDALERDDSNELVFEVLARDEWRRVSTRDETQGFARRGFVFISVNNEPRLARLFGRESYWMRVRPRNPGIWRPQLKSVFINAVLARQAKTVSQEALGSSSGEPNLQLTLSNQPVLTDSLVLRVEETLSDDEKDTLNQADEFSSDDDPERQAIQAYDTISLQGDWVLWQRVDSFVNQEPDARVYRLDAQNGVVTFGDDKNGRIPPAGSNNIRAIRYQTGGGTGGNVSEYLVTGLKSAVESVERVANPIAAAGGTDFLPVQQQVPTAPARIRRNGQALTPPDIESLVVSSNPLIVRARCLYPQLPGDGFNIAVSMQTGERCPVPSKTDQLAIQNLVRDQAWGALDDNDANIIAPEYIDVTLRVTLIPIGVEQAATLEQLANKRLRRLLNPIEGGPKDQGWPFGRRIWESDVIRALSSLPGFDRLDEIELATKSSKHDLNDMSPIAQICADQNDITVIVDIGMGGM